MRVILIVAHDLNKGIGANNDLMWKLPADMKFFKETTTGFPVIMGRKNFDSIPEKFRPLPNRTNIILSKNKNFEAKDCLVFENLKDAINSQKNAEKVFIIGGGQIYKQALDANLVDEMFITIVQSEFNEADTFFCDFDEKNWERKSILKHPSNDKNKFDFEIFHLIKKPPISV